MTPDPPPPLADDSNSDGSRRLPEWYPSWARELCDLYFSGTTSTFVLYGNVFDHVRRDAGSDSRSFSTLNSFLSGHLFGRWDFIVHYDLARGLRLLAGSDASRLREMVTESNREFGDIKGIRRDPGTSLAFLDRVIQKNLMAKPGKRFSLAVVFDHASAILPRGELGQINLLASTNLVTVLNWASSPYIKRLNLAFVFVDAKLASLNERLTGNPHVAALEVELPGDDERQGFIEASNVEREIEKFSDYGIPDLAKLTAGISLSDIETLIRSAKEGGKRLDASLFFDLKKRLIERQCGDFLEFVTPSWGLEMVVGHEAAKARLGEDAMLLAKGQLQSLPMGYLLCGPVGTGKSFLAQCATGSLGVPCVILKNFRSKYVGETEGNLERVLAVLRAMGPVVVIVDEADAMLGDRDKGGDSGTSSRVFAMIAAQMGNTKYRGRILWMLLTCRPDLLPIDLKRQGRAEVHIPLFYPTEEAEVRGMFAVMAKKLGTQLDPRDLPSIPHVGNLSGADIEGIVGRALRKALLANANTLDRESLQEAIESFMPSTENLERELQETAAIIECTDRQFLPPSIQRHLEESGGRVKLQERLTALKRLVDNG